MADNLMRIAGRDPVSGTAKAIQTDASGNVAINIKSSVAIDVAEGLNTQQEVQIKKIGINQELVSLAANRTHVRIFSETGHYGVLVRIGASGPWITVSPDQVFVVSGKDIKDIYLKTVVGIAELTVVGG